MTRWEYCVISGIATGIGLSTYYPYLIHFTPDGRGYASTHLEKTPSDSEIAVVAKTIAKLGENGWEMVSAVYNEGSMRTYSLYFKRPKP